MSIYWERCFICDGYRPTYTCSYKGSKVKVCARCLVLLNLFDKCNIDADFFGSFREASKRTKKALKKESDVEEIIKDIIEKE